MRIAFEDTALEELYVNGATDSSKYRKLPKDLIKQYIKVVNYIRAARRLEDLFCIKSSTTRKRKATCKELMPYG